VVYGEGLEVVFLTVKILVICYYNLENLLLDIEGDIEEGSFYLWYY